MLVYDEAVKPLVRLGARSDELAFYKSFGCYLRQKVDGVMPLVLVESAELKQLAYYHLFQQLIQDREYADLPEVRAYLDAGDEVFGELFNAALLAVYYQIDRAHGLLRWDIAHDHVLAYIDELGRFNVEGAGAHIFRQGEFSWPASMVTNTVALGLGPSNFWCQCEWFQKNDASVARLMSSVGAETPSPDACIQFLTNVDAILVAADAMTFNPSLAHAEFPLAPNERVVKQGENKLARYINIGRKRVPFMQVGFLPNRLLDMSIDNLMRLMMAFSQYRRIATAQQAIFYIFGEGANRDQSQMLATILECLCRDDIQYLIVKWADPQYEWDSLQLTRELSGIIQIIQAQLTHLAEYQAVELSSEQLAQLPEAIIAGHLIRYFSRSVNDTSIIEELVTSIRKHLHTVEQVVPDLPEEEEQQLFTSDMIDEALHELGDQLPFKQQNNVLNPAIGEQSAHGANALLDELVDRDIVLAFEDDRESQQPPVMAEPAAAKYNNGFVGDNGMIAWPGELQAEITPADTIVMSDDPSMDEVDKLLATLEEAKNPIAMANQDPELRQAFSSLDDAFAVYNHQMNQGRQLSSSTAAFFSRARRDRHVSPSSYSDTDFTL